MSESSNCLLLSRLKLTSLVRECLKSGVNKRILYWDPYSKDLDLFTSFILLLFSRDIIATCYSLFFKIFGLKIYPVPHADQIQNYHSLQLTAENETRLLLSRYYSDVEFSTLKEFRHFGFDKDSESSLTLQQEGLNLYCIIENVKVLQSIGFNSISIELSKGAYSKGLREILSKKYTIFIHDARYSFSFITGGLVSIFLFFIALKDFVSNIIRHIRTTFLTKPSDVIRKPILAVEFVDPLLFSGSITEPNYLTEHGYDERSVYFYARSKQFKELWKGDVKKERISMFVDLTKLPFGIGCLKIQTKIFIDLIKNITTGSISISKLSRIVTLLETYKDLVSLFSFLPVSAHMYNIIPNGRVTTRFDSGLVTGVCRQFGIRSYSYQSRVMYRHNLYYHFNVFDIYFFWGAAWLEEYKNDQFINKYQIIGNPNKLDVAQETEVNENLLEEQFLSVAIFTSDINDKIAFHYTHDYTEKFLKACFIAIGKVQETSGKSFKVCIKLKEERHKNWFDNHTALNELVRRHNISLTVDHNKKYDTRDLISSSNSVISIGFTTPGFDALCLKKNSIYFTPYRGVYNSIFDKTPSLVANTVEDLVRFLSKGFDHNAFESKRGNIIGYDKDEVAGTRLRYLIEDDLAIVRH